MPTISPTCLSGTPSLTEAQNVVRLELAPSVPDRLEVNNFGCFSQMYLTTTSTVASVFLRGAQLGTVEFVPTREQSDMCRPWHLCPPALDPWREDIPGRP